MSHHHTAKKRFGQNFLTDTFVIHEIMQIIRPKPDDCIVEIGPGLAALTTPLLEYVKQLHVVEIDRDIIQYLQNRFSQANLIIHAGEALKFDYTLPSGTDLNAKIRVVGNLP